MLYGLVIAIHIVASLVLIAVILLQAGKGGGLNEAFGGGSTQTILGTKTSVFLKKATAACAVIYIVACLLLAVMTSHRGRSIVAKGVPMKAAAAGTSQNPFPDGSMDY
jgi:preprotein translocase subunit SecG